MHHLEVGASFCKGLLSEPLLYYSHIVIRQVKLVRYSPGGAMETGDLVKVEITIEMPQPSPVQVNPKLAAVVVVDMEEFFLDPVTNPRSGLSVPGIVRLLSKARAAGVPIIYVQS